MVKLKKRKDGRYRKSISTSEGVVYVYGYTEKELNDNYIDVQIKLKKNIKIKKQKIMFGDYAIKWFEVYKANKSEKTKDMYYNIIFNHIDVLADISIGDITPSDVQKCINECFDKPNLCRKVHMTIKQIFNAAIVNQIIVFNPCSNIDLPQIKKSVKNRDLTDQEREALFHADLDLRTKAYLYLGAFCGLRKGEILALTKDDFDFTNNTVSITKSRETGRNVKARIKDTPKTDSSVRDVILIDIVRDTLTDYINSIDTYYLFTMKNGEIMSESSYKKFWKQCKKQLNMYFDSDQISNLSSHILRHEFSTNLFYAGVDELETQRLMGHSDIATTRKIYTHLRNKNRQADIKLNNFINKKIKKQEVKHLN